MAYVARGRRASLAASGSGPAVPIGGRASGRPRAGPTGSGPVFSVRGSRGSVTTNVVPAPRRLSTVIRPPCMSTIDLTIARPRPLPLPRASLAREPR